MSGNNKEQNPFFIITSIKHPLYKSQHFYVNNDEKTFSSAHGERNEVKEDGKLNENEQSNPSSVSIVRVVETSDGMFMLDFSSNSFMAAYTSDNYDANAPSIKLYIEGKALGHLQSYAELLGKEINVDSLKYLKKGEGRHDQCHNPILLSLLERIKDKNASFIQLEKNTDEVIQTSLSLGALFSWKILADAKDRCDLRWKDLRKFLTKVRRNVPFLTNDGIPCHDAWTQISFFQFIAFARLMEVHLERMATTMPHIKAKVGDTSTSTVDIKLCSSHDCVVNIGVLLGGSPPPSALVLSKKDADFHWSAENICLKAQGNLAVNIDSLRANTVYDIYIYVERQLDEDSKRSVVSSDADVLKSRITVVTDHELENIFPSFDCLNHDEQKAELLAITKDKTVRSKAQAAGLVIPVNMNQFISAEECTPDWYALIQWWRENQIDRNDFCMREMRFAAMDRDIRRCAEMNGISMRNRTSKDPALREQWKKKFSAWYFGRRGTGTMMVDEDMEQSKPYRHPKIFVHDFSVGIKVLDTSEDEQPNASKPPEFHNNFWKTSNIKSTDKQEHNDLMAKIPLFHDPDKNENKTLMASGYSLPESTKLDNEIPNSLKKQHIQPKLKLEGKEDVKPKVNDEDKQSVKKNEAKLNLTPHRSRFLERLSLKIDTAVADFQKLIKVNSAGRGIELFRAKVRLVIMLHRIAPRAALFEQLESATSSIGNLDILKHFDDSLFNFDTLASRHRRHRPAKRVESKRLNSVVTKKAKEHRIMSLSRKAFNAMLNRTRKRLVEKKKLKENIALANVAHRNYLLSKYFHALKKFHIFEKENPPAAQEEKIEEVVSVASPQESVVKKEEEQQDKEEIEREDRVVLEDIGETETVAAEEESATPIVAVPKPPCDENGLFALEDAMACAFRKQCRDMIDMDTFTPTISGELELGNFCLGKPRPSGLTVVCKEEYNKLFASSVELNYEISELPDIGQSQSYMLDRAVLNKLKEEKMAGASNIYDVPDELVCPPPRKMVPPSEYRTREKVRGIAEPNVK